jgi:hypothetical protein
MDAKLTLKLDRETIEGAKRYAERHQRSLSRLIESYLRSLAEEPQEPYNQITPFIKSISTGVRLPADLDYKKIIAEELLKKHG